MGIDSKDIALISVTLFAFGIFYAYMIKYRYQHSSVENERRGGDPTGERHRNEPNDAGKISDEEMKNKRHQLIRSRLEFRQISSTLSPLSDTITRMNDNYRVKEISQCDLESGEMTAEISQYALRRLTKMGYDENVCMKALKAVGGSDVEAAVYWIFEHKTIKSTRSLVVDSPPEGVPIIKKWEENTNGGIFGRIHGSPNFEDGDFVETSRIVKGVIEDGSVVATKSGNRYFLSTESANITSNDDETSTHSRFDSVTSRLDACRYDCVCSANSRRNSAKHSVRSRLDSLESVHSRRGSANHSVRNRRDSLDSVHSRRDSAKHSVRNRRDSLGSMYSRRDSASHSMHNRRNSLDSMYSRRDSASHSVRSRRDSLDSMYSRRDSASQSMYGRLESLECSHNNVDIDSTNKSTQSFADGTIDSKTQEEVCSICIEPYRAGDIVVRLKQKQKPKDNNWFQDTLSQLKNRTQNPNYDEDPGSNHWFDDIVSQLKEATEEIHSNRKPTTCNHWYHEECIIGWLEKNDDCPLCRINMIRD